MSGCWDTADKNIALWRIDLLRKRWQFQVQSGQIFRHERLRDSKQDK
jgi:hypothetical protein